MQADTLATTGSFLPPVPAITAIIVALALLVVVVLVSRRRGRR